MIFLNIQESPIKHAFQMSHRAASFSNHSAFQCGFKLAKKHWFNHVPKIPAKQPISLKVLFDSPGYMTRTLLRSKVDELFSWVRDISYNGNLKAGRLNKIPVALQTNGLK